MMRRVMEHANEACGCGMRLLPPHPVPRAMRPVWPAALLQDIDVWYEHEFVPAFHAAVRDGVPFRPPPGPLADGGAVRATS